MRQTGRITTKRRAVAGYTAIPGAAAAGLSTAAWFSNTLAFAKSISAGVVNCPMWSAELTPNPGGPEVEFLVAVSTGAAALLTTLEGGQLVASTGTTANSTAAFRQYHGATAPKAMFAANMKTSTYVIACVVKIAALHNTCTLALCGMSDEAVLSSYLGVVGATSTTNLVLLTTAAHDLGVALPATGTFADLLIYADGTHLNCYLGDGTGTAYVAAGAAQDQSVLPTNPGHVLSSVGNGANTTNAAATWDKYIAIGVTAT